jgi:hypothetical protein
MADARAVASAVTGVVDAGAMAGIVDAGGVARTVTRRVAGVVAGILPTGQAVQEMGGGGGQPLGAGGDVVGYTLQHASHLVGGTNQRGFAQRLQRRRAPTDGDRYRTVGPVAGSEDDPREGRVAPAPRVHGV